MTMVNLAPGETIDVEYEAVNTGDVDSTQTLELTLENGSKEVVQTAAETTFTVGQTGTGTLTLTTQANDVIGDFQLCVESKNSVDCVVASIVPSEIRTSLYYYGFEGVVGSIDLQNETEDWTVTLADELIRGPVVFDGDVYYLNFTSLYSLDSTNGSENWSLDISTQFLVNLRVYRGNIYFNSKDNNTVYSVDPSIQSIDWSTQLSYTPQNIVIENDSIYVIEQGSSTSNIDVINRLDGTVTNTFSLNFQIDGSGLSLFSNGYIYFINDDSRNVARIDTDTGAVDQLGYTGAENPSEYVVDSGVVYAQTPKTDNQSYLVAIDADTGDDLWEVLLSSSSNSTSVNLVKDGIYIYASDGDNRVLKVNTETETVVWDVLPQSQILDTIALVDNAILCLYRDSNFYALDPNDGSTLWTTTITPAAAYDTNGTGSDGYAKKNKPELFGIEEPAYPF